MVAVNELLHILTSLTLGLATGINGPIAGLAAVALARLDLGFDFDDSALPWLESPAIALLLFGWVAVAYLSAVHRRGQGAGARAADGPARTVQLAASVVLAALLAVAETNSLVALPFAASAALFGALGFGDFFARAARRAERSARTLVVLTRDLCALAAVAAAAFVAPLGAALALLSPVLWWRAKGRADERPAGLRILR